MLALDPIVLAEPVRGSDGDPLDAVNEYRLSEIVSHQGWDNAKTRYPEVRQLLQRVGTDAGRVILGENVWVDATLRDLGPAPVVVTDVRFPNEARAISALGGIVVRVERPGCEPPVMADGSVHVSETALEGYLFDEYLLNYGTLEELHEETRFLVERTVLVGKRVSLTTGNEDGGQA